MTITATNTTSDAYRIGVFMKKEDYEFIRKIAYSRGISENAIIECIAQYSVVRGATNGQNRSTTTRTIYVSKEFGERYETMQGFMGEKNKRREGVNLACASILCSEGLKNEDLFEIEKEYRAWLARRIR